MDLEVKNIKINSHKRVSNLPGSGELTFTQRRGHKTDNGNLGHYLE